MSDDWYLMSGADLVLIWSDGILDLTPLHWTGCPLSCSSPSVAVVPQYCLDDNVMLALSAPQSPPPVVTIRNIKVFH